MAEILKARDLSQAGSPIVAVKRILPHLVDDRQFVTMFLDESRVLAQLTHPNIIRTLAVGQVEETPFIALEYVFGPDARNVFHRSRRNEQPIPIAIGCYVIAEVCAGLDHAHEQTDADGNLLGVVHRDVSLQNVLLSYDGEVKLTDFGIARSAKNVARTEVGVVKGKFGYMSPEQIRGEPMDRRSDVFATGICLYELLTSERLFSGDSDYAAVEKVRNVVIEPPSRWNRLIPSSLEAIVMKALAKHPRDRFQSAADMRRALLSFMSESNNECSPRMLSQYLRGEFAEELQKHPTPESLRSQRPSRRDEPTGLAAFDNLKPVTSVSAPFGLDGRAAGAAREELPVPDLTSPVSAIMTREEAWPEATEATRPAGTAPEANGTAHAWDEQASLAARAAFATAGLDTVDGEGAGDDDVTRQMPIAQANALVGGALQAQVAAALEAQSAGAASPFVGPVSPAPVPMPVPGAAEPTQRTSRTPPWTPPAHLEATATYGRVIGIVAAIVALIAGLLYATRGSRAALVHFSTVPTDAEVWVDARRWPASASPFVIDQLEPDRPHRLEVKKAGYQTWSAPLTLASGQVLRLPLVTLAPLAAPVQALPAVPAAQGPVAKPSAAPAAPRASDPQLNGEKTVAPAPAARTGARTQARAPAKPKRPAAAPRAPEKARDKEPAGTGLLRINSRPWSTVSVDGRPVGNTPQIDIKLSAGTHTVRLENPEFKLTKTLKVRITANETVTKVVDLR